MNYTRTKRLSCDIGAIGGYGSKIVYPERNDVFRVPFKTYGVPSLWRAAKCAFPDYRRSKHAIRSVKKNLHYSTVWCQRAVNMHIALEKIWRSCERYRCKKRKYQSRNINLVHEFTPEQGFSCL